jgi:hypothetical protein
MEDTTSNEEDIKSLILQTGISKEEAIELLNKNNGDLITSICDVMDNINYKNLSTKNKKLEDTNTNIKYKEIREILNEKEKIYVDMVNQNKNK